MTARNKNIPALRFKGFEGEWNRQTLFDISEDVSYGMNAAATEFDGIHKYIRITDIDSDSRKFNPNPLTSPGGPIDEKYKLKENDIVFARTGASVGKSYLYDSKDGALYYAGFLIKFSITKANPYFIYSLTLKENYDKWVHIYSMRSGQPGLNAEEYKALKLNIPSLPEQQKIASFLSSIDEKIRQLTRRKELLEQYKKGVMQQLFSGKLRFKDEKGKAYPKWEESGLGDHIKLDSGFAFKGQDISEIPGGIPLMRGINITEGYIRHSEDIDRYYHGDMNGLESLKLVEGDLVLGMDGSKVGKNSALVTKYDAGTLLVQRVARIRNLKSSSIEFIYQHIRSPWFIQYVDTVNTSSGIPHISSKQIKDFKISFPVKEEQLKIASFLSSIDTKIESVTAQIKRTQRYKKGLLQQMFV